MIKNAILTPDEIRTILTPDERAVYRLNRHHKMKDWQILIELKRVDPTLTMEKVRRSLDEIDRKAYISARYEALYDIIEKYLRVFKVAKEHLEEKNDRVRHVFNIDFSDIYVYLNPSELVSSNTLVSVNNIGSIYYMLDPKYKKEYCLLPPAIWELINKLNVTQKLVEESTDIDAIKKITAMKKFFKSVDAWDGKNPEEFSGKIMMPEFNAMGPFLQILSLTDQGKLSHRLKHNYKTTMTMLDKLARPIDDFIGDDVKKIKIHEKTYDEALGHLTWRRPAYDRNNQVDAANVAITYDLTSRYADEKQNNEEKTIYRFVSHSKLTTEAFRNIGYNDLRLSCCPQFVSTLILAEKGLLKGGSDIASQISYFDESIRCAEGIKSRYADLKHPKKFMPENIEIQYLADDTLLMREILAPVFNHIMDLTQFKDQIYQALIGRIMDINAGENVVYEQYRYPGDAKDLAQIFEDQGRYKDLIAEASGIIYDDLKATYNALYQYVDEKNAGLLTADMRKLLDKLNKEM